MSHTHTPECGKLLGMLSDYLDGELRAELCRQIEQHLAECDDCRVVVDTTRKTIEIVHTTAHDNESCPEDVRERLFKRLNLDDLLSRPAK